MWRARLAIRQLLSVGRCSGRTLERLVGHISFLSLGRRETLSVLGSCFAFISTNYDKPSTLWSQVRLELSMWDGLAPLIVRDLSAKWSSQVHCVDASEWGLGVCEA